MGIAIGGPLDRLRRLDALLHAKITAGKRGGYGQIGIGIGTRHAVFDPKIGGVRRWDAKRNGAVVDRPVDVRGRVRFRYEPAIGVDVGGAQREGRRHVSLETPDVIEEEL